MRDLYPGYDVLSKRNTPSWNEQTRAVIDQRLKSPRGGGIEWKKRKCAHSGAMA